MNAAVQRFMERFSSYRILDAVRDRGLYIAVDLWTGLFGGLALAVALQPVLDTADNHGLTATGFIVLLCGTLYFVGAGIAQNRYLTWLADILFGAGLGAMASEVLTLVGGYLGHPQLFDHSLPILMAAGAALNLYYHSHKIRHPEHRQLWYDALGFDTMGSFFSWCVSTITYALIIYEVSLYRFGDRVVIGIAGALLLYAVAGALAYLKTRQVTPWVARANLVARMGAGAVAITLIVLGLLYNEGTIDDLSLATAEVWVAIAFGAAALPALFVTYKESNNWLMSFGHTVGLGCGLGALLGLAGMGAWAQYSSGSYMAEMPFLKRDAGYGALAGFAVLYFLRHDPRVVLVPVAVLFIRVAEVAKLLFIIVFNFVICGGIAAWIYWGQKDRDSSYDLFHPHELFDWILTGTFVVFSFCAIGGTVVGLAQIVDQLKGEPSRKLPKPRGGHRKFAPEGE